MPRADSVEIEEGEEETAAEGLEVARPQMGGSVVPLPTRTRPTPVHPLEPPEAASDARRVAGESRGDGSRGAQPPRMPAATVPGAGNIGELVALRMVPQAPSENTAETNAKQADDEPKGDSPEHRFFAALAEIRALKRAANQAGE